MRLLPWLFIFCFIAHAAAQTQLPIRVSQDGKNFVRGDGNERFVVWGVNYDHNGSGELLDEYWIDRWDEVVEDFAEIKNLGANCVRVHLQLGKFLDAADQSNQAALQQLAKLVQLAEQTGLYLDITGLACYHKANVLDWYDQLSESDRWRTQSFFWESVSAVCHDSPAVFCYDLMNEPTSRQSISIPRKIKSAKAVTALEAYDIGKPLVVEEMFPLKCAEVELADFVTQSSEFADGWISLYWGSTSEQLRQTADSSIAHIVTASWLERFQAMAPMVKNPSGK